MKGELHIDASGLNGLRDRLEQLPDQGKKALRQGMESAVKSARTVAFQEIPKVYALNTKDARLRAETKKGMLKIQKDSMDGTISISGRLLTMGRFPFSPKSPSRRGAVAVTVKNGSRKRVSPKRGKDGKLKNPFVARTGAGSAGKIQTIPFVRTGEYKDPDPNKQAEHYNRYGWNKKRVEKIRPLYSLSIPQAVENPEIQPKIEEKLGQLMVKRVEKRLDKELKAIERF